MRSQHAPLAAKADAPRPYLAIQGVDSATVAGMFRGGTTAALCKSVASPV